MKCWTTTNTPSKTMCFSNTSMKYYIFLVRLIFSEHHKQILYCNINVFTLYTPKIISSYLICPRFHCMNDHFLFFHLISSNDDICSLLCFFEFIFRKINGQWNDWKQCRAESIVDIYKIIECVLCSILNHIQYKYKLNCMYLYTFP